jgi:hypothetical protein
MSAHIDGEEEQLQAIADMIADALFGLGELTDQRQIAYHFESSLHWIAREAFRRGYQHAHKRTTVPQRKKSRPATTRKLNP